MQILRIEDNEGRGAYYSHRASGDAFTAHNSGNAPLDHRHPPPDADYLLAHDWRLIENRRHPTFEYGWSRFGFLNAEQYHEWFYTTESRTILRRVGLKIRVYDVPEPFVLYGKTQVIFHFSHAALLGIRECDAPPHQLRI